jgi:hypothetical protein
MTLRELTAHAERCSRALIEHLHSTLLAQVSDFRDLSRPVRRKSHYPSMVSLYNALKTMLAAGSHAQALANELQGHLEEIHDRALREKVGRT